MRDSVGREINIGDEVAFTVGTGIYTGIVVRFRTKVMSETWQYDIAKVALTKPENRGQKCVYEKSEDGCYVTDKHGRAKFNYVAQEPKMFRDVVGSDRIILLKPLDNLSV